MGQIFLWVAFPVCPVLLLCESGTAVPAGVGATLHTAPPACPFQASADSRGVPEGNIHAPSLSFLPFHTHFSPPFSCKAVESKDSFSFPLCPGEEAIRFFLPHFHLVRGERRSGLQVSVLFPGLGEKENCSIHPQLWMMAREDAAWSQGTGYPGEEQGCAPQPPDQVIAQFWPPQPCPSLLLLPIQCFGN